MEEPQKPTDEPADDLEALGMTAMADMLIVTHIPYYILMVALVAELWLLRRRLRQLSRIFEVE